MVRELGAMAEAADPSYAAHIKDRIMKESVFLFAFLHIGTLMGSGAYDMCGK